MLSRHIVENSVDQDFDQKRCLLFIVREDGKFATLIVYRVEQMAAWMPRLAEQEYAKARQIDAQQDPPGKIERLR